jgi:hypothetical protein
MVCFCFNEMHAEGVSLYVNCSHPACCRSALVKLDMLIERLGGDHRAMHHDLVGKFACSACRDNGRDIRPVFFTIVQNYERDQQ